jgi:ankyrin repeat protein
VKNKYHGFIKGNDYMNVRKLTKLFNVDPHEELSKAGYFWNSFHYACHFDKPKILEYLIQVAYRKFPEEYE